MITPVYLLMITLVFHFIYTAYEYYRNTATPHQFCFGIFTSHKIFLSGIWMFSVEVISTIIRKFVMLFIIIRYNINYLSWYLPFAEFIYKLSDDLMMIQCTFVLSCRTKYVIRRRWKVTLSFSIRKISIQSKHRRNFIF